MVEKSTKGIIIEILVEEWPLSARVITNRLRKKYAKSITYQAVHKTIIKMLEEGTLIKEDKKYSLDSRWIMDSKEFFDYVEKKYKDKGKIPYKEAHKYDNVTYSFKTGHDLGDFIVMYLLNFPNKKNKIPAFKWTFMYSLIGLSKTAINNIKSLIKQNKYYIACISNSLYDKIIARTYKLFGKNVKIKLGIGGHGECDYMIVGDYICRIYYSPKLKEKTIYLQKITKNALTFNIKMLLDDLMFKEFDPPHLIKIEKDPVIADQIRKSVLSNFDDF